MAHPEDEDFGGEMGEIFEHIGCAEEKGALDLKDFNSFRDCLAGNAVGVFFLMERMRTEGLQ